MKRGRREGGFTLVEAVASWTILLIALTIFLKCITMSYVTMERGRELQRQCMAALERAEFEEEPLSMRKTDLKLQMDTKELSMEAVILEYGTEKSNTEDTPPVTLKVMVPVAVTVSATEAEE